MTHMAVHLAVQDIKRRYVQQEAASRPQAPIEIEDRIVVILNMLEYIQRVRVVERARRNFVKTRSDLQTRPRELR
ncbi:MAG: hypothetical protein V3T12_10600, partial [Acidiferrobacterales bacterium]